MFSSLLFKLGLRRKLTLEDFSFSDKDRLTQQSLDAFQRFQLFRICEVIRLCNEGELRIMAGKIRDLIMESTKSPNNLLPHEQNKTMQKTHEELPEHPLLPRYDLW